MHAYDPDRTATRLRARVTDYDSPADAPGFLLWRATNRWQRVLRETLESLELTHVQFVLLATLSWLESEGPVTQRSLADLAGTDPMMTSQVLRALEQKGFVTREPHPTDGRARVIAPTKQGRRRAMRALAAVEEADRRFFAGLGRHEDRFMKGLRKLSKVGHG
jgi:DNA-binding MarR family transcriptional regulator